jgi:hypothetical protein
VVVKWETWGKYAVKAKGYSISKAMIDGKWLYTLWKLPATSLGNFGSANDAKKAHLEFVGNEPPQPDSVDSRFGLQTGLANSYTARKG